MVKGWVKWGGCVKWGGWVEWGLGEVGWLG